MDDRLEMINASVNYIQMICESSNIAIITERGRVRILDLETKEKYDLLKNKLEEMLEEI
ncbi:TPA: hypothetical protein SOL98_001180 [Clostridioides difficile]|uniref:hypothetical protein n=1 Tax=Clostridioides difficile TaxID=1496 RepID=UPI000A9FB3E5|nr:hypothetical protein [Clostridioides difficile]MBF8993462.1 hypothetical protein [Clostridioides difficile]MBG0325485.1 hypothetical protein [Clostridioides difficile]MCJ0090504.1 hypothetical protein [Clostridioides difficile]MCJ0266993.1 hypothetical protein [Clostridioides difficile]MCJ0313419.1 hypothetical protein [Clostridioides difficile]